MSVKEKMTAIADAIREKTGGTAELNLEQMAEEIAGLETGGADEQAILNGLCEGEWPVGDITLQSEKVRDYCFGSNTKVTNVFSSSVREVGLNAFNGCTGLISVNMPAAETLRSGAFYKCTSLLGVNLPIVTSANSNDNNGVFQYCSALRQLNLPIAKLNGYKTFANCTSLTELDFPFMTTLAAQFFLDSCYALKALILRSTGSICTLTNGSTGIRGCGITQGTGYIYVPAALLETYKTATNWSSFAAQFRALEDYTVDGTTIGELDWDLINMEAGA